MKCHLCQGTLAVYDSREMGADGTGHRRRRRCLGCGNRVTTFEVAVADVDGRTVLGHEMATQVVALLRDPLRIAAVLALAELAAQLAAIPPVSLVALRPPTVAPVVRVYARGASEDA